MGKVLECLASDRLREFFASNCPLSERQYGFMPGRSSEDCVSALLATVTRSTARFVVVVFLDISGAFDNAWWPAVLAALRRRNIPASLYELVRSFFRNRHASLRDGSAAVEKEISKGCRQGSVLAPLLWNLLFDEFLSAPMPEGVNIFGYADDGAIAIEANSRSQVESRADLALAAAVSWAVRNKLRFSVEKTEAVVFKGPYKRSPMIRLNGDRVKVKLQVKYLGVILDRKLNFNSRVTYVSEKAKTWTVRLKSLAATRWGLRRTALTMLYDGAVVPTVTYASSVWAHRLRDNAGLAKTLNRAQWPLMIAITGAYRTVPSNALQILAGKRPLDLEVRIRSENYARRNAVAMVQLYRTHDEVLEDVSEAWQNRWDSAREGRVTYALVPDVRWRLAQRWFHVDHFSAQFLTGHGAFQAYLHRFELSDVNVCDCDVVSTEDSSHTLLHCEMHAEHRSQLTEALHRAGVRGPWSAADLVVCPGALRALARYAKATLENRERR